jgi:hypothetical protein
VLGGFGRWTGKPLATEKPTPANVANKTELLHADSHLAIGTGENVFVIIWRAKTTSEAVQLCRWHFEREYTRRSRKFVILSIIERLDAAPDPKTRRALTELLASGSQRILASALVFEGSGFHAAAVRSVVTGISLLARHTYPHRVFEKVSDAAAFLDRELHGLEPGKTPATPTPREVETVVAALRQLVANSTARS